MSNQFQPQPLNDLQSEMQDALDELYTTDVSAETLIIDDRPIAGSLTFEMSEVDLVSGGWKEGIASVFTTLKKYFPSGKWPRVLKSEATHSVNGTIVKMQVGQIQGNDDNRAQLLIGFKPFTSPK